VSPTRTNKSTRSTARKGTVAFVGTGPGDARLLTVRATELLASAEAVVLDRVLTEAQVRPYCREDVEVLDGTHDADGEPLSHAQRAKVAVAPAKSGKQVVCLRDGDPALFGGLAEEAAAAAKAGVGFEVVPGVPSVTGVPAYAGVPLTTDKVRDVRVVDAAEGTPDWATVGAGDATLVVLGAVGQMAAVAKALVAAGRAPGTPVSVTTQGTTTDQKTVTSTLESVAADVRAAKLSPPAVTVVGDVVGLRDRLSWFETKPLFGWRVLVPRTKEQAVAMSEQLRGYGAVPEEVPTISVEPPRTPQQMERALKGLVSGRYQWVAFTSQNAVKAIREKFEEYGLDARAFAGIKVAAVGEQTAEALERFGVKPDLVPSGQQSSEGLLADWPPYDSVFDPIDRVLLPRADIATDTLVAGLKELGWEVDDVTAYRTVRAAPPPAPVREAIKGGGFDAVLFTSSSTVRNLVGIAGKPHACTVVACIGPQTAATAEELGLRVDVQAPEPSSVLLAESLAEHGTARRDAALEAGEPVLKPSEKRAGGRRKR
jgi:uroporphyrinogen III methyltransferase / synthase